MYVNMLRKNGGMGVALNVCLLLANSKEKRVSLNIYTALNEDPNVHGQKLKL